MATRKETTEVTVSLDTGRKTLSMSLDGSPSAELTAGMDKPMAEVKDITLDGVSVVEGKVGKIRIGAGLKRVGNAISITTEGLSKLVPKSMGIQQQSGIKLLAERDGAMAYVSVTDLGYTRMKVGREADLSELDDEDFLFVKENK